MIMGRVTYLHHYLPTLWFAVIMAGFCLDHFVFTARRFSSRTKAIVFAVVAGLLVGTGFWMRACAWGIEGDIANYKHRLFRRVRRSPLLLERIELTFVPTTTELEPRRRAPDGRMKMAPRLGRTSAVCKKRSFGDTHCIAVSGHPSTSS